MKQKFPVFGEIEFSLVTIDLKTEQKEQWISEAIHFPKESISLLIHQYSLFSIMQIRVDWMQLRLNEKRDKFKCVTNYTPPIEIKSWFDRDPNINIKRTEYSAHSYLVSWFCDYILSKRKAIYTVFSRKHSIYKIDFNYSN